MPEPERGAGDRLSFSPRDGSVTAGAYDLPSFLPGCNGFGPPPHRAGEGVPPIPIARAGVSLAGMLSLRGSALPRCRAITIAVPLLLCQGCTGYVSSPELTQPKTAEQTGDGPGLSLERIFDGATAVPAGAPVVSQVRIPPGASGAISVELTIEGAGAGNGAGDGAGALQVAVEVSRDGGATFRPATITAGAAVTSLVWSSLDDIGFRTAGDVILRFTVTVGSGGGVVAGARSSFLVPRLDNLRAAARRVDRYTINYGSWTDANVALAKRYQLVIAAPGHGDMTAAQVRAIQLGADAADPTDDVIVICYLSAGEDLRTGPLTIEQIRADPRFRGDGTGPRIDPRGPTADGASLAGIDPRGRPSNGGAGFASYYLDDNSVHDSASHVGDGIPDRNANFGSLFVNAGDPAWFDVVDAMALDGADGLAGLREILTTAYGRGLGCDGVFLDTMDTAAPNSYTDASSVNESKFEWTAPGLSAFVRRVHQTYPNALIAQNRGLFYFDPRHPQYAFNARGALDFVLFESYRLNSSSAETWNAVYYPDNRYNVAPKLMADANRPDGFKVLSLGYAAGPPDQIALATLTGASTLGYDTLMEDIHVAQDLAGFRHYLADPLLMAMNDFVRTHASLDDAAAPTWTSTYNDRGTSPATEPTPRVGIQRAAAAAGGRVTVWWDVAMDKNRVHYVLYAQPQPFDFARDPGLTGAAHIVLSPEAPADYVTGVGPDRYAYQATLSGFPAGVSQHLLIRAVDESAAANQDANTVVVAIAP
jgi:hypothetical protein